MRAALLTLYYFARCRCRALAPLPALTRDADAMLFDLRFDECCCCCHDIDAATPCFAMLLLPPIFSRAARARFKTFTSRHTTVAMLD